MYLSRLILNPQSRQVQREIANLYDMHRTIMHAFPQELPVHERVLYRLEIHPRSSIPTLLVQSQTLPDWSWLETKDYLLHETGLPLEVENPGVKQVELSLHEGQILSFRLRANPTVKKDRPGEKQGKRVGLYDEADQIEWLKRKLSHAGARLLSARTGYEDFIQGVLHRDQQSHDLKFNAVQFEGILQVEEVNRLQEAIAEGIGPAKGFGFGLLSLAPT